MATDERPNQEDFRTLTNRAGEGPVVMLNLLAFESEGGQERYREYTEAVQPMLETRGGSAVYLGRGAELLIGDDHDRWDAVLLVRYPSRAAFLDMIGSDEYQAIQHLRTDALTRSVLLATDPFDPRAGR